MPQLHVGTSGWSYPQWKHTLYRDVPQRRWLERYARVFNAVEANITYRRDLTEDNAAAWIGATPPGFRFVIKAHQRTCHFNRLRSPNEDAAAQAFQARMLGSRLGLVYFQVPHNFLRDDDLLEAFLARWPQDVRSVWEFTHSSWHEAEVHDLLRSHSAGWVVSDAKNADPQFLTTSPDGYVRLRRDAYDPATLEARQSAIKGLDADRTWVFVRHGADAPELAETVRIGLR